MKTSSIENIRKVQPHIKVNNIRKYVILPGDPDRIDKILGNMRNTLEIKNNRGLRISEGEYDNIKVSVASTGMGCPSAAIVCEELANVGAKVLIRIGTCGGLLKEMEPGDLVIPDKVLCYDGTTREYNPNIKEVEADKTVLNALVTSAEKLGVKYFIGKNRTHDLFYEPLENFLKLEGKGLISSEMECSSVFLISKLKKIMAGAVLVVNTPEPIEEVKKNPALVYQLVNQKKVVEGIQNAIKVILEAIKTLEEKRKKDGENKRSN